MNSLLLGLLLAPLPASADPALVAASASAQQILHAPEDRPRALGRRPSEADPRPDTATLVLAVERVAPLDEELPGTGAAVKDTPEFAGLRARLEQLYKTPAHITVTLRRDPSRRGAWTARVSAAGREVGGRAYWSPEGLYVSWDWRERADAPDSELSFSMKVEVDAQGRLTPVRHDPVARATRVLSELDLEVPSPAACHDCGGSGSFALGRARIMSFTGSRP